MTSVVIRTDVEPSEALVVLTSGLASTEIRLSRIVHARVDVSDPEGDLVDEVVVRELPKDGPWPAEAQHLLQHHNNRSTLYWLTLVGPSEVEVVAESFEVG